MDSTKYRYQKFNELEDLEGMFLTFGIFAIRAKRLMLRNW